MAMGSVGGGGRGRGRSRRGRRLMSEINVTPMVDVMLVLLIVFMVAAPMLTVGIPVELPKTKAATLNDTTEPLVISVDKNGTVFLQESEIDPKILGEKLKAITGNNPNARIYVRGDANINYGKVAQVMGVVTTAGFTRLALVAEVPE